MSLFRKIFFPDASVNTTDALRTESLYPLAHIFANGQTDSLITETVGTGTATYGNNALALSVAAGQYEIHRSRQYLPHIYGKTHRYRVRVSGFQPQANVTKRIGYFSSGAVAPYSASRDGVYLEAASGAVSLMVANNGSVIDIVQSSWNKNTMPAVDWSFIQEVEFVVSAGMVRLFLRSSGGFVLCHEHLIDNQNTAEMCSSMNQNLRFEIVSSTGAGSMTVFGATAEVDANLEAYGKQRTISTGNTAITTAAGLAAYPLLAVRKAAGFRHAPARVIDIAGIVPTADRARLVVHKNPTFSAPLTFNALPGTGLEFAVGNGAITATALGAEIGSMFLSQNSQSPSQVFDEELLSYIGSGIDDVSGVTALSCVNLAGALDIYASMDLKIY